MCELIPDLRAISAPATPKSSGDLRDHRCIGILGTWRLISWRGADMSTETIIIIVVVILLFGGGWYGRGRWY